MTAFNVEGSRYEIVRVGAGGMGAAYLVRDRVLDRLAALKVIRGRTDDGGCWGDSGRGHVSGRIGIDPNGPDALHSDGYRVVCERP